MASTYDWIWRIIYPDDSPPVKDDELVYPATTKSGDIDLKIGRPTTMHRLHDLPDMFPDSPSPISDYPDYQQDWPQEGGLDIPIPQEMESPTEVTGGSSPNVYRRSLTLPTTADRGVFVEVDIEIGDIIEAWKLNFNEGNILKSVARGDNKEGVDTKYALDKTIWFGLREKYMNGIISHKEFWQQVKAIGLSKEI